MATSWNPYSGTGGVVGGNMGMGMFTQPQGWVAPGTPGSGGGAAQWRNPGGSSGGYGSTAGPTTLSQMIAMQREENAKTKAQNQATRQATLNELGGVATAFQGDPLWQATRQSAQNLLANPEAINDQTQQLIQNRASNQTNAAANTERDRMRRQLASQGMLDSSAGQGALGQLERDRMAGLADSTTSLEIQRANQRNQNILQAQQAGASLAGQQNAVNQFATGTRAATDLYFQPENLSGYAGYFAGGSGGGASGYSSPYGPKSNSAPGFQFNTSQGLNPWGPNSPGQTGFSPGLRGNYDWTGQMSGGYTPQYQGPSDAWYANQQQKLDAQNAMDWSRSFDPGAAGFWSNV